MTRTAYIIISFLFIFSLTFKAQDKDVNEVPFIISQTGQILVQAQINNHSNPTYFYIETSGQNMMRSDQNHILKKYGLDTLSGSFYIKEIRLGNMVFEAPKFKRRKRTENRGEYAFPPMVIGTLGPSFFKSYAVQFDFEKMILRLTKDVAHLAIPESAYSVMYRSSFRDLSISLEIDTRKFGEKSVYVSTRSPLGFHFYYSELSIAQKSKYLDLMKAYSFKLNGEDALTFRAYELDEIFIENELIVKDQEVWFSDNISNSIGVNFLKNYIFTIDFPNRELYFEPINAEGEASMSE